MKKPPETDDASGGLDGRASATLAGFTLLERFPSRTDREQVWIAQPEGVDDPSGHVVVKLFATEPADVAAVLATIEQRRLLAMRYAHDNIASILNVGSTHDAVFIVRQYVLGFTLREIVQAAASRGRRLPPWLALSATCNAARTVAGMLDMLRAENCPSGCSSSILDPDNLIIGLDGNMMFLEFWMPTPAQLRAGKDAPSGWHDVWHPQSERALSAAIANLLLDLLVGVSDAGQVLDRVPASLRELIEHEAGGNGSSLRSFVKQLDDLAEGLQWNTTPRRVAEHMSLLFSQSYEASPPYEDCVPPPETKPYGGALPLDSATARSLISDLERSQKRPIAGFSSRESATLMGHGRPPTGSTSTALHPPQIDSEASDRNQPPKSAGGATGLACPDTDRSPDAAEATQPSAPTQPPPSINPLRDSSWSLPDIGSNGPETPIRVGWDGPEPGIRDADGSEELSTPVSRRPSELAWVNATSGERHAWDRAVENLPATTGRTPSERVPHVVPDATVGEPIESAWDRAVRRLRALDQTNESAGVATMPLSSAPEPIRDPVLRARRRFDEGLEFVRAGRYEAALEPWLEAATLAPDNRLYQSNLRILRRRIAGDE